MPRDVTTLRRAALLAAALAAGGGPRRAAHPPVRAIIARFVAARGGIDRLRAVRTLRMVGTMAFGDGPPRPARVELARPARVRTEITMTTGTLVQAFDGCTAWMIDPGRSDGAPRVLDAGTAKNVAAGADIDGPLVDAARKGNRVTFAGIDTAGGRPAWALRVVRPDSTVDIYDIDTVSYRQTKWAGQRTVNGHPVVYESYFHDYRAVRGVLLPFRIDSRTRGRPGGQRIVFDSIAVNPPLPNAVFAFPGGAPAAPCVATR